MPKIRPGLGVEAMGPGAAMIRLLDRRRFDLVITDIAIPEIGGIDQIRVIRAINKKIPIIAISGEGTDVQESNLTKAIESGANFTLQKPFRITELLNRIQVCLSGMEVSNVFNR